MIALGIDVGSRTVKAVVLDSDTGTVLGTSLCDAGPDPGHVAADVMAKAMARASVSRDQLGRVVATGYGRAAVADRDETITEITCHAAGVAWLDPAARTVIDIGGQDSKVIRVEPGGAVIDFVMNDRCAAGTGRFLELASRLTDVPLEELGARAAAAESAVEISSMCVVFAESEIHGLLARRTPIGSILAGAHRACALRIVGFVDQLGLEEAVVMVGGVARNEGMVQALAAELGVGVSVPEEPQLAGALGAAVLAARRASHHPVTPTTR
jgi:predicted CoA-substrate-specific enzyme activase